MKVLVIGKVIFTKKIIKKILKLKKISLVGVVTNNNKNTNHDFVDLTPLCKKEKINIHKTKNINSKKTFLWINRTNPDCILCLGYPKLLKGSLLKKYKNKIIGFHPTSLPLNRGRHPLIWTLLLNVKKSACTFFYINKDADGGKLIDQTRFNIYKKDNANTLYNRITKIAENRIDKVIKKFSSGYILCKKNKKTNLWRKRDFHEAIIDWRMSCEMILRHINALNFPYCYAEFIYKNKKYKILSAKLSNYKNSFFDEFGKVVKFTKSKFIVKCGDGYIEINKTLPKISLKKGEYL